MRVVLRPPVFTRVYGVVFVAAVVAYLVVSAVRSDVPIWPSLFFAAFALVLLWRINGQSAVADGEELRIRNFATTRTLARSSVEGFAEGPYNGGRAVFARTPDGLHALAATADLLFVPGARRRLDDRLARLESWLHHRS
jgi:hypothetical protein